MAGDRFYRWLAGIAVGCAAVSTLVVVGRATGIPILDPPPPPPPPKAAPVEVVGWEGLIATGHRMGPTDAKVVILEFSDFECPFCRRFTVGPLAGIRKQYPNDVAVVFRHWPLPYHRFALPALQASECASAQGRFAQMHDLLFAKQDSLGLKSFPEFGSETEIMDAAAFARCMGDTPKQAQIEAYRSAARAAGGLGTPTVIVNGWRYGVPPDSSALDSIVRVTLGRGTPR